MESNPFLGFAFHGEPEGPLAFREPLEVIEATQLEEVLPALRRVQQALDRGYYAAGSISYEAAPAFDPALRVRAGQRMPLLWFGVYAEPSAWKAEETLTEEGAPGFELGEWEPAESRECYSARIARIKEAIAAGETYQVNYTMRLRTSFRGSGEAYYQRLSRAQKAGYGAYLRFGAFEVLSVSPELFFRVEEGRLTTRPMKGTIRRGRFLREDDQQRERLRVSGKDRAENLMITDLLRNDLGRVAVTGTVEVPELFQIESYPTVFQMTSTVTCKMEPETTLVELFAALFPCGSVTGAPKVNTMEHIAELEAEPREVYCGAIGYAAPYGRKLVFNVPIRTVWLDRAAATAEYSVGGGVTWDSSAAGEYEEALAKAAVLRHPIEPFCLLESLLLREGEYWLLERHRARLRASAAYFGFLYREEEVEAALASIAREHPQGAYKIRLLLAEDGAVRHEAALLSPAPSRVSSPPSSPIMPLPESHLTQSRPERAVLAEERVDSRDPFLYHKTTRRGLYSRAFESGNGAYDVLLQNERGELTEFTRGNLVVERGGQRWTPPVEAGLLAGTFRDELLARGEMEEKTLTASDLRESDRIWFINSIRGWVEVTFLGV
ncbi:aminodeoxychorismate synthase component I [Gorillibacterium sp. CAU 1737]|uniref:aminodeoxychorismate synthase component I n=1 Tax=Gorillibacterium sp. CAU 1737 TaxID=3140362 RepID=UPI0032601B2A